MLIERITDNLFYSVILKPITDNSRFAPDILRKVASGNTRCGTVPHWGCQTWGTL